MPTVPRLDTRRVGPNVVRQPQQTAAADPFAGVAAGLGAAAEMVQKEVETARARGNEIRLNSAEVKVRELRNRILNGREKGVLNQRGERSFKAPEEAEREWTRGLSAIGAELTDPDVQEAFRARADQLGVELRDVVNRHVTTEMEREGRLRADQLMKDIANSVVGNAANSEQVAVEMARAEGVLRGQLRSQGERSETQDSKVAELRSQLRLAQVEALAANDPEMANKVLTDHLDEIAPSQRARARTFVDAANMAVRSQTNRDIILGEFGDDEKAALEAVHARYEGAMEDQVSQRVQAAYADRRRLLTADTNRLYNEAAAKVIETGDMGTITPATLATLTERDAKLVGRLERLARQTRTGEAAETNWEVWTTLTSMTADQLRDVNPLEYKPDLAEREFRALDRMVSRARGTGQFASDAAGMTEAQLTNTAFEQAQRLDLLPRNVTSPRALKGENGVAFSQLMDAVQAEMDRRVAEQDNRPLSRQQQREAINAVYDDMVMEKVGFFGSRQVPRAMVADPTTVRELTAEERPFASRFRNLPPAERWEALVRAGVPKDSATAIINRQNP